jgi:hypothetical protein
LPDLSNYLTTAVAAAVPKSMLTKSTAGKDVGTLRRVLGTMVALMLAGGGLGVLGALVYPAKQANLPTWKDADRRASVLQQVRPNSVRSLNPTIRVVAHCSDGRDIGALHDAHNLDGKPSAGAAVGRNLPLVHARCDGPQRGGAGRLWPD